MKNNYEKENLGKWCKVNCLKFMKNVDGGLTLPLDYNFYITKVVKGGYIIFDNSNFYEVKSKDITISKKNN